MKEPTNAVRHNPAARPAAEHGLPSLAAARRRAEGRTLGDAWAALQREWAELERELALLKESIDVLFGRER